MKKDEAAIEILSVRIPPGYLIGAQSLPAGKIVGTLEGTFATNNPWEYAGGYRYRQPVGAEGGL